MFTKRIHVSLGVNSLVAQIFDCSLLEMLRERTSFINSAARCVESDSQCERTACVTTSISCMYAENTLMRPYVSFHVDIAARFVIIED